jgi:hypothetical protein
MMSFSYRSFVEQKIKTAQAIAAGCCGGTYAEGSLILCSIISAMSAIAWPGDHIDKKRFVEIITRYPLEIDPKKVSRPLLVQDGKVCNLRIGISEKAFKLTEANDLNEEDVVKLCPDLKLAEIRKYSYAHLLYEQIRCSYAHEYRIGQKASDHDSIRQKLNINESDISYVYTNRDNPTSRQVIHFPLKWIASVAEGVARGLDIEPSKKGKIPFEELFLGVPTPWWLEGAGR